MRYLGYWIGLPEHCFNGLHWLWTYGSRSGWEEWGGLQGSYLGRASVSGGRFIGLSLVG